MRSGTTEDVRRSNLSAILRLLYRDGPASRATLSKATGRNRSTTASLVADLVELNLVTESDPQLGQGRVGRPSPVLFLRPELAAIAINPEIDVLTISLVGLNGTILRVVRHEYDRIPTAAEAISISAAVISGMRVELEGLHIVGIGVAVPGQVQTATGVVRNAPHLGWVDEPIAAPLSQATGYRVSVANDAALGALAEHEFGSGRGYEHLIYLNGGASGIGGGVITSGRLLGGTSGHAGEFGHIRVSSSSVADSAGILGTLEAEVNRSALHDVLGQARVEPGEFTATLLAHRSPKVTTVVHQQLRHLGSAVATAINLFDPQVIALGGFLAALQAYDPEYLTGQVAKSALTPSMEDVHITSTEVGENLLMIGAAGLAFAPMLADPASIST